MDYEIVKKAGIFAEGTGSVKALCLVRWGKNEKYDIREWAGDFEKPYKGITATRSELVKLRDLINKELGEEM